MINKKLISIISLCRKDFHPISSISRFFSSYGANRKIAKAKINKK
jgi:hypothetical protein